MGERKKERLGRKEAAAFWPSENITLFSNPPSSDASSAGRA
jgi:hypothetical protein